MKTTVLLMLLLFGTIGCDHSLDFLKYRTAPEKTEVLGVVFYDRWRAHRGVNLINDSGMHLCRVIDMFGKELGDLPGGFCIFLSDDQYFAVLDGPTLFDKNFTKIWSRPDLNQHHVVRYDKARDWLWMVVERFEPFQDSPSAAIDTVVAIDRKTGKDVFRWDSLENLEQIKKVVPDFKLSHDKAGDIARLTHYNWLELIGDNVLVSDNASNLLFVIDLKSKEIVWSWLSSSKEGSRCQHSPRLLADGSIVMFINSLYKKVGDKDVPYSELYWLNPKTKDVFKTFTTDPSENLFSERFGYVQPLANGNILIGHNPDRSGSAFEITSSGRVVWQWINPILNSDHRPLEIYMIEREDEDVVLPYLRRLHP